MIKFSCLLVRWFTCTNNSLSSFGDLHVTICLHLTPPCKKGVLDLRRPKIWNYNGITFCNLWKAPMRTVLMLFLLIGDFFCEIANILQLWLVLSEFTHRCAKMVLSKFSNWGAKNTNFRWCANSRTGVRKKNIMTSTLFNLICPRFVPSFLLKANLSGINSLHFAFEKSSQLKKGTLDSFTLQHWTSL